MAERHEHHHAEGSSNAGLYILLVFVILLILGGFWWFTSDRGETTDDSPEIELNLPEGEAPGDGGAGDDIEVPEGG